MDLYYPYWPTRRAPERMFGGRRIPDLSPADAARALAKSTVTRIDSRTGFVYVDPRRLPALGLTFAPPTWEGFTVAFGGANEWIVPRSGVNPQLVGAVPTASYPGHLDGSGFSVDFWPVERFVGAIVRSPQQYSGHVMNSLYGKKLMQFGSGIMVGPRHFLTSAHLFLDHPTWNFKVRLRPWAGWVPTKSGDKIVGGKGQIDIDVDFPVLVDNGSVGYLGQFASFASTDYAVAVLKNGPTISNMNGNIDWAMSIKAEPFKAPPAQGAGVPSVHVADGSYGFVNAGVLGPSMFKSTNFDYYSIRSMSKKDWTTENLSEASPGDGGVNSLSQVATSNINPLWINKSSGVQALEDEGWNLDLGIAFSHTGSALDGESGGPFIATGSNGLPLVYGVQALRTKSGSGIGAGGPPLANVVAVARALFP